jgi:hypothetical protein
MSEFAKAQLLPIFNKPLIIAPLGFNNNNFKIIDSKEAKYILGIEPNTFVFFSGNSNQPKKRLDIIIRSFVNFLANLRKETIKETIPPVILLMNCCVDDNSLDIPKLFKTLCEQVNILDWDKHIKLTTKLGSIPDFNDEDLSILYSASDIGLCSSMGEAWGLVNFEHAGFGKAQIIPAFSTIGEVLSEGSIRILPLDYYVYPTKNLGQGRLMNHQDLTQAMEIYYNDDKLRIMDGFNNKKNVLQYTWKSTTNKILWLIQSLTID